MFRELTHQHGTHEKKLPNIEEGSAPSQKEKLLAEPTDFNEIKMTLAKPSVKKIPTRTYFLLTVPVAIGVLAGADIAATVMGLKDASDDKEEQHKLVWLIEITKENLNLITGFICSGYAIQLIFMYVPFVKSGLETTYEIVRNRRYPEDKEEWPELSPRKENIARGLSALIILPSLAINGVCTYFFITDQEGLSWNQLIGIIGAILYVPANFVVEGINCLREIRLLLSGEEYEYPPNLARYKTLLKYLINIPGIALAGCGAILVLCEDYAVLKDPNINTRQVANHVLFAIAILPGFSDFFFELTINRMAFQGFIEESSKGIRYLDVISLLLNITSALFVATALSGFMGESIEEFDLLYLPESVSNTITTLGITSLATSVVYMSNELFDRALTLLETGIKKIGSAFSRCRQRGNDQEGEQGPSVTKNPYVLFSQTTSKQAITESPKKTLSQNLNKNNR